MKKLKTLWAQLLMWFDMKVLALLGFIINHRINAYLPDLGVRVEETVRWNVSIAGMRMGFSAKMPKSYTEMGIVLESVGKYLRDSKMLS
ncbi:MAG: hypothetical protein COX32_02850 [Candidatus Moranbacteria bacterium CG23_combo_of_CG06-09_8_20_14_all_41_28]|nr:MAG: hypothetical protein COX32_02850 [Candidatus Moranbacteria bacterium CG23_combo_of_CG06-09_8_20_14_all_41_28]